MDVSEILSSVGKKCYLIIDLNLENGQYDKLLNVDGIPKMVCGQKDYDRVMKMDIMKKIYRDDQLDMIHKFSIAGMQSALRNQNMMECEYQIQHGEENRWVRVSVDVVKRLQEKVIEVVIGFTDITQERSKELEAQRRERRLYDVIEAQNEQLKHNLRTANRTNHAKTQFLSNLSHEMRASLNAIMGMTEIAKKNYTDTEIVKEILNNMQSPIVNLTNLLNRVTDVKTIENGKSSAKNERLNIKDIITECCEILRTEYEKKNHKIQVIYHNLKHENIISDAVCMKQIFLNVLENAIKFTQKDGTILFEISELSCSENGKCRYCISIQDNGIGMQKEFLDTIFEPFAKHEKEESVGIGLSIVKNLTELLGGQVKIYSAIQEGTKVVLTFTFSYEQEIGEKKKKESLLLKKYENLFGKKILLVEDERIHRQILVYNLEEQGVICDWAKSGEEALTKLKVAEDDFYQVILTDIRLPGMKGNELTQYLRNSEREYFRRIPIIAVSADAMDEDMKNYMKSGIDIYLTKPIVPENLYKILNQLFESNDINKSEQRVNKC